MSHMFTELRHPPLNLTPRQAEKRPMRSDDTLIAPSAVHHDKWDSVSLAAVELVAASASVGLMWGLMMPSGQKQAPAGQWMLASLACLPVMALTSAKGVHHHSLKAGVQPPPRTQVIPFLLVAALLGLSGGRFVGNTLGSVVALLRF